MDGAGSGRRTIASAALVSTRLSPLLRFKRDGESRGDSAKERAQIEIQVTSVESGAAPGGRAAASTRRQRGLEPRGNAQRLALASGRPRGGSAQHRARHGRDGQALGDPAARVARRFGGERGRREREEQRATGDQRPEEPGQLAFAQGHLLNLATLERGASLERCPEAMRGGGRRRPGAERSPRNHEESACGVRGAERGSTRVVAPLRGIESRFPWKPEAARRNRPSFHGNQRTGVAAALRSLATLSRDAHLPNSQAAALMWCFGYTAPALWLPSWVSESLPPPSKASTSVRTASRRALCAMTSCSGCWVRRGRQLPPQGGRNGPFGSALSRDMGGTCVIRFSGMGAGFYWAWPARAVRRRRRMRPHPPTTPRR